MDSVRQPNDAKMNRVTPVQPMRSILVEARLNTKLGTHEVRLDSGSWIDVGGPVSLISTAANYMDIVTACAFAEEAKKNADHIVNRVGTMPIIRMCVTATDMDNTTEYELANANRDWVGHPMGPQKIEADGVDHFCDSCDRAFASSPESAKDICPNCGAVGTALVIDVAATDTDMGVCDTCKKAICVCVMDGAKADRAQGPKIASNNVVAAGCDQCDATMINGRFCHETGCPNAPKKCRHGKMSDVCSVCSDPYEGEMEAEGAADSPVIVTSRGTEYEAQIIDPTHLSLKMIGGNTGMGWVYHIAQVGQFDSGIINQLKEKGLVNEEGNFFITTEESGNAPVSKPETLTEGDAPVMASASESDPSEEKCTLCGFEPREPGSRFGKNCLEMLRNEKEQEQKKMDRGASHRSVKSNLDKCAGHWPTSWTVLPNGDLQISLGAEAIPDLVELTINSHDTSDALMYDVFETVTANGLNWVAPEDIGALTDAPILTDSLVEKDCIPNGTVWWYPNYEVRSPLEDLAEKGVTVFTLAPSEDKMASLRIKANALICPGCEAVAGQTTTDAEEHAVATMPIRCPNCGEKYPESRYVLKMAMQVTAGGIASQIRSLKNQLKDAEKPSEISAIVDALDRLEARYEKQKEHRKELKENREKEKADAPADKPEGMTGENEPVAEVAVRAGLNPEDPKVFFDYCWSFYGPNKICGRFFNNQLDPKDLEAAIQQRIETADFAGDSFDREAVRDLLLEMPKYEAGKRIASIVRKGVSRNFAAKASRCIDCGKSFPIEKMVENVHGAGYLCATDAPEWNKDTTATIDDSRFITRSELAAYAADNATVISLFVNDSFPKDKKTEWGTPNLQIRKYPGGWALVNYATPILFRADGSEEIVFNTDKYSVSTSRIQNMIRQEVGGSATEVDEAGIQSAIDAAQDANAEQIGKDKAMNADAEIDVVADDSNTPPSTPAPDGFKYAWEPSTSTWILVSSQS